MPAYSPLGVNNKLSTWFPLRVVSFQWLRRHTLCPNLPQVLCSTLFFLSVIFVSRYHVLERPYFQIAQSSGGSRHATNFSVQKHIDEHLTEIVHVLDIRADLRVFSKVEELYADSDYLLLCLTDNGTDKLSTGCFSPRILFYNVSWWEEDFPAPSVE